MKNRKPKITYPSRIHVDSIFNTETKKINEVWISTGPYSKALCGETQEEVNSYLSHIVERYRADKAKHMAKEYKLKEAINGE